MSLECLSGRKHSILDDIDDQVGAYMYQDEQGLGIIRAGSAAVGGLRRRHNGHVKASKQANTTDLSSQFYSAYPDQGSPESKPTFTPSTPCSTSNHAFYFLPTKALINDCPTPLLLYNLLKFHLPHYKS
jgi:hypothetical protein